MKLKHSKAYLNKFSSIRGEHLRKTCVMKKMNIIGRKTNNTFSRRRKSHFFFNCHPNSVLLGTPSPVNARHIQGDCTPTKPLPLRPILPTFTIFSKRNFLPDLIYSTVNSSFLHICAVYQLCPTHRLSCVLVWMLILVPYHEGATLQCERTLFTRNGLDASLRAK